MAYIVPADLRLGSGKWWVAGYQLEPSDAEDAQLTAAIEAMSRAFDLATDDYFEAEAAVTLELDGGGGRRLLVPKRIRTITSVDLRDSNGALTSQGAEGVRWEVMQSLVSGARQEHDLDYLQVRGGQVLTNGRTYWPPGIQTVKVVGDFSWATTPDRVKMAIAILCWHQFKGRNKADLDMVVRYDVGGTSFERLAPDDNNPFGIAPVDAVVREFRRSRIPAV